MQSKWDDYLKVDAIIRSCTTSRHNCVAFSVLINFDKKWKDPELFDALHRNINLNLLKIMGGV